MLEKYLIYLVSQERDEQMKSECDFHCIVEVETECEEDRYSKQLKAIKEWQRQMDCKSLEIKLENINGSYIWTAIDVNDEGQDNVYYYLSIKPLLKKIHFFIKGNLNNSKTKTN